MFSTICSFFDNHTSLFLKIFLLFNGAKREGAEGLILFCKLETCKKKVSDPLPSPLRVQKCIGYSVLNGATSLCFFRLMFFKNIVTDINKPKFVLQSNIKGNSYFSHRKSFACFIDMQLIQLNQRSMEINIYYVAWRYFTMDALIKNLNIILFCIHYSLFLFIPIRSNFGIVL